MWGYSGGSLATDLAAQAQPTYASGLHFKGIALGGMVADIQATLDAFSGGPAGGAIVMGFAAVNRDFPSANLLQYLNAAGRKAIAAAQNDCLVQAAASSHSRPCRIRGVPGRRVDARRGESPAQHQPARDPWNADRTDLRLSLRG